MLGTLHKQDNKWVVTYPDVFLHIEKTIPLHPTNVKEIEEWSLMFDNMEGRINNQPEVEFELCMIWDVMYARILHS
jgi:hypothetical protein